MPQLYTAPERCMWYRPRSVIWWEVMRSGKYPETWWTETYVCLNFIILCRELQTLIERQETTMRHRISVQAWEAPTIWRLATNIEYWTLSVLFGIGRSTVRTIVISTCNTIATHLFPWYVCFPTGDHLRDIITNLKHAGDFHRQLTLTAFVLRASFLLFISSISILHLASFLLPPLCSFISMLFYFCKSQYNVPWLH